MRSILVQCKDNNAQSQDKHIPMNLHIHTPSLYAAPEPRRAVPIDTPNKTTLHLAMLSYYNTDPWGLQLLIRACLQSPGYMKNGCVNQYIMAPLNGLIPHHTQAT